MDKNSAVKLLDETFNKDFDVNRYLTLIKELFNNFNVREYSSIIWKEYQHYIENYKSFGTYTDSKKKVVDVLVVKLKKTSSRDRARTMQRNFIAKYLGNAEKDAALVAFYGDDEDWRFSFVKMEYNLVKDETGKVKVAKELTPAKRYSFLVGVNEPNHTAQQQLYPLLKEEDVNPTLDQIEHAFSIERVTKEFFDKYKGLFLRLKESLEKVVEKDSLIKKEFDIKNISVVDFSKKLLGQIVFIYFLQKKGWLGVERGEKWGTGPKNFMRALLGDNDNKPLIKYKNFFNEILEPLFYDALANSREGDDGYHTHFKCKIPFLNGGLFEPMNDYDWVKTDIILDNNIFEDIFNTFDEFNFTVKEDEPLEKEVAVDPEMLGKVFENLLDVIDRKSKGAFYTPREIVHYMCQQSLINYLETNSDVTREDIEKFIQLGDFSTSNDERVLEDIKSKQDKLKKGIINASTFDTEVKQLIEKLSLPKSIIENKEKMDDLLKEIKVVDPAVGSGAFPVGMLNEIVKARATLSIFLVKQRNDYDLKREIIENCLYGVDIDSSAVDITKLRFWLSLIVDELDMKNIKPLPNLDHKIMCGNSLLEEFEGKKLFDEKLLGEVKRDFGKELKEISEKERELYNDQNKENFESELKKLERKRKKIQNEAMKDRTSSQATLSDSISLRIKESQRKLNELKRLQKEFFNEENKKLKKEHRERIDELEWELVEETLKEEGNEEAIEKLQEYKKNKSKPFFLWKLYFAEVFQRENPGFDVVIGNPPYFQLQKHKSVSVELANQGFETYSKSGDIYCIFYEKGINILRKSGTLTYISSNSWLKTKYGSLLRKFLKEKTNPVILIDFTNSQVFSTAIVESCVIVLEKSSFQNQLRALNFNLTSNKNQNLSDYFNTNYAVLSNLDGGGWIISDSKNSQLREKIHEGSVPLKQLNQHIRIGLLNGYNDAYIISTETKNKLIKDDPKSIEIIKPLLRGRDVGKYYYDWKDFWLINSHNGIKNGLERINVEKDYPAIYKYLLQYKEKLEIRKNRGLHWTNLRNCAYFEEFEKPKIIWGELSDKPKFAFDDVGFFAEATLFVMVGDDLKYLLGILNSNLGLWYFEQIATSSGMGTNRWKKYKIEQFPIKNTNSQNKAKIESVVNQILSITKDDDYLDNPDKKAKVKRLEKEIDQLVYKLYDLTSEEIKIVEGVK